MLNEAEKRSERDGGDATAVGLGEWRGGVAGAGWRPKSSVPTVCDRAAVKESRAVRGDGRPWPARGSATQAGLGVSLLVTVADRDRPQRHHGAGRGRLRAARPAGAPSQAPSQAPIRAESSAGSAPRAGPSDRVRGPRQPRRVTARRPGVLVTVIANLTGRDATRKNGCEGRGGAPCRDPGGPDVNGTGRRSRGPGRPHQAEPPADSQIQHSPESIHCIASRVPYLLSRTRGRIRAEPPADFHIGFALQKKSTLDAEFKVRLPTSVASDSTFYLRVTGQPGRPARGSTRSADQARGA